MDHIIAILAPVFVIQLILWFIAFRDLAQRETEDVTFGKKLPWVLIILFISCGIGAVIYLVAGRKNA